MDRRSPIILLIALLVAASAAPAGAGSRSLRLDGNSLQSSGSLSSGGTAPNDLCAGGFEDANYECWEISDVVGTNHASISAANPHSGTYSAEICAGVSETCVGVLEQTVQVPDNVTGASMLALVAGSTTDSHLDCSTIVGLFLANPADLSDQFGIGICEAQMDGGYVPVEAIDGDLLDFLKRQAGGEVFVWAAGQAYTVQGDPVSGTFYVDDAYLAISGTNNQEATKYPRSVTLSLRRHLKAKGNVSLKNAGPGACFKNVKVKIQRKVDGKWTPVATATTDVSGDYKKAIPDKKGTYRAVAPRFKANAMAICGKAISDTRTHKH